MATTRAPHKPAAEKTTATTPAKKATRTRKAPPKDTPTKPTAAKKTTARKTAAQPAGSATTKAATGAARTKKTPAAVKKTTVRPEFITHKMITAHYQARLHGLPTRNIRDWKELPTGVAAIHFPSGARLDHTPKDDAPFHANTPCPQGVIHRQGIHTLDDLAAAEADAKACTDWHGEAKPTHLSARLSAAKKATAKTQPMNTAEIAEGLAQRAAANTNPGIETAKEHPEP